MSSVGEIVRCEKCGHIISKRKITLYRGIIFTLKRVYKWCKDNGIHEFTRKEIKHLFFNENDTARFGDLIMFGGLVYKLSKGRYGLNMERCFDFFNNRYLIPSYIWKNPITGELEPKEYKSIKNIPGLDSLLTDGEFVAEYKK